MRSPMLFAFSLASALALRAEVPPNLVAEGIPPIPPALVAEVAPYLTLGGASFRGWHSTRREILVTTRAGGVTHLHRATGPLRPRTGLTRGIEPVKSGAFQPGGDRLVFQRDRGGDELYQYYALDVTDAQNPPVLLTDGEARNTGAVWSHDGRWPAYASTRRNGRDSDIFIVDPTDPKTTRCLLTNKSPSWSVSDWSRDGSRLLVRHSLSDEETVLWVVDARTGEKKRATAEGAKDYFKQACFAENDTAVYAVTDAESDSLTLVRLDPLTGTRTALTAPHLWDVEEFALSHDGRTLAYTLNEDGFSRLHLLDVATRQAQPVPRIPGDLISSLEWHRERRELGFTLNGAQSPSDAWSLEVDGGELTRWTDRLRQPQAERRYAEPEIARMKSHDGLDITALVYRPDPQKFPGRRPVLVNIHGGPASQSRPGFRGSANYYLNELGSALVYPNIRGSTGYGRKFMALDNGLKREDAIRDIGAVLGWIATDPVLDADALA